MNGPVSVVPNFSPIAPTLSAAITSRTGSAGAKQWTITLTNSASLSATIPRSPADHHPDRGARPVRRRSSIVSPSLPLGIGNIGPLGSASGSFTINFGGFVATARFTVNLAFQANGTAYRSSATFNNQFY